MDSITERCLRLRANGRNKSQQCWELLRACWQWCANGCNNSQQCWDLQCIVGRIELISLCKPCVMSVRGPNNVGRAVQTDPTLLCYASAIREQKKCWQLLAVKFDRFQTLRNKMQQHPTTCNRVCKRTQHVTSNNVESCWSTMLRPFAWGLKISSWYSAKVSFYLRNICHECVYDAYINIGNGNSWRGRKTEN